MLSPSELNPALTHPLYRQLYLRLRQSIADGRLRPGDRLPSVRALAAELNLARGTVDAAYQLLVSEGYLQTRGPAGTVVSPLLKPMPAAQVLPAPTGTAPALHTGELPPPLQMGLPALDAFPRKLWNRLANRALRGSGLPGLAYPSPLGYAPLRMAVASYLGISRGIACTPEQVFICAGYRAGLELICRTLLAPGAPCWFEDPGYFMAREFLQQAGARLVPVPVDAHGLDVAEGLRRAPDARLAVVTPTHQSPLGVALTLPRRQALLAWANQQQSWIIEDDYDSEYRYHGKPLPALKSLDTEGRVLYAGTFSKVLAPGLRLAYLVVPQALVGRFASTANSMQNHCPVIWQATVTSFIDEGHFARHLKRMRGLYAQRRAWLVEALHAALAPRLQVDSQAGGMHVLARLGPGLDDHAIAKAARALGLAVHGLSGWYQAASSTQGLLLGFTNVASTEQAAELAQRLALAFEQAGVSLR
ncbi:PLP-dependent aminotransferase family protein [Pseudomonas sp. RIT-PI-S]|uniref:MocR-like pyridoxine biosynthesis transcription factor PdxR n=1 Tax=Pseudomonas sp. RIT-PI-S TaxID=3035295 RepID=UPI0021DA08A1|nr:PLP-dependent aminotransferase family protein [Pseudomonas sp. RIT-PI-S]